MTLTMTELAGLGATPIAIPKSRLRAPDKGKPSQEDLARYGKLRPTLSSLDVSRAENEFQAAVLDSRRAGEASRRCAEYLRTNRKPTDYGFSTGCGLESSAASAASRRVEETKRRLEELREQMGKQRMESYEVDLRQHQRSAPILYTRGGVPFRSGGSPFYRQASPGGTPPPPPPPARKSRLPLVLGGVALLSAAVFMATR
jgi:hypothetical protein